MRGLDGKEDHPDAIFSRGRQGKAEIGTFACEKLVGDLNQDSSAIAGFRIAAAGAAMRQIDEDFESLEDDLVRLLAFDVDHEAKTAGIVLITGVLQTLLHGESVHASKYSSALLLAQQKLSLTYY